MNPVRRRRLLLVVLAVIAAGIAIALAALALQRNVTYLYTPSEVLRGETSQSSRFRLGGVVCEKSFVRAPGSLEATFRITDRADFLQVNYAGILPDLFREGQSVIATGHMDGNVFVAEDVLAKHDETYMPKEVAEKMAQAKARPHSAGCGTH
ncbi:cytochrome c maturation protein CcmE [Pseudoluteimonas lycopersici]|uniref:Cytochrome c-type biogenesis protein CcmE n=1 Tax=Pseudoluteimonas lycopersici TaxID=1324796 RepID=A0A516V2L4_9GAMM|nr:cytochrome c maturation protein CcmE [Lysobacter lycopersici]QDQ72765.1 cytochrome c maturation protein CcmE [Lysobacter lycopersici]